MKLHLFITKKGDHPSLVKMFCGKSALEYRSLKAAMTDLSIFNK